MTQKQLINANNAELNNVKAEVAKLPMADDVKNGRYVWGKYDAKGGTLLSFTISDSETAYPDGGEKDGFWWEMVKQGLPITKMGFTKFTYGEFVLSTDNELNFTLTHNLGVKPKKVCIYTEDSLKGNSNAIREVTLMNRYTSFSGDGREYYFESGVIQSYSYPDQEGFSNFDDVVYPGEVTESIATFKTESYRLLARGKKYYWYALA